MTQAANLSALAARLRDEFNGRPKRGVAVADPASSSAEDTHASLVALLASLRGAGVIATEVANANPDAAFSFATDDLDVTFTDASTDSDGTIVSWAWDFGDDATSTEQNPTHSFAAAGTYDVQLTVTDDDGGTDSVTHSVTVSEGAAGGTTAWDPSRKAAFVTLSGGDLVATIAGQGKVAALAPRDAATANYYWEVELTDVGQYLTQGIMAAGASTYTGTLGQAAGGEFGVVSFQGYCYHTDIGDAVAAFGSGSHSDMGAAEGDVVKMLLRNGALYYGIVGHGWYDASSQTYKASIADAAPFVTGLDGSWSPAESTGSGGATGVATARFAAADWAEPESGADEWPSA